MLGLKQINGKPIMDNFRPVQPLNDREVKASFQSPNGNGGATTTPAAEATSPTVGASAVRMTAGLFFSIPFAAFFLH